jgi:hypothetical protein
MLGASRSEIAEEPTSPSTCVKREDVASAV